MMDILMIDEQQVASAACAIRASSNFRSELLLRRAVALTGRSWHLPRPARDIPLRRAAVACVEKRAFKIAKMSI